MTRSSRWARASTAWVSRFWGTGAGVGMIEKDVRGAEFFFFDSPRFDQVLAMGGDSGVTWTAMSMQMVYWAEQQEADDAADGS